MTPDELVERVKTAVYDTTGFASDAAARVAIAIALQEAARVAKDFPARTHGNLASAPYAAAEQAAEEIAAAILALIHNPEGAPLTVSEGQVSETP